MKANTLQTSSFRSKGKIGRFIITTLILLSSCDTFLDVEFPKSKVASDVVFNDDVTATSAVTGIYVSMLSGFANAGDMSVVSLTGLSSDEFINYPKTDAAISEFEENSLQSTNKNILSLWTSLYATIYQANAVLEGLSNSNGITKSTKDQLKGESFFIRAFTYSYLVALFGDVPLVTTTDYRTNSRVAKSSETKIYEQIVSDLTSAYELLTDNYITTERVRPNKATVLALLARAYLYTKDWKNAEYKASEIISNASYSLTSNLNSAFLKNSPETIWQLRPAITGTNGYTNEAFYFVVNSTPKYNILNNRLLTAFESGDKRFINWIGNFKVGTATVYFPSKYKQNLLNSPLTEYSMVFRLAEQYLIRSEARAQQGNLSEAIEDIDVIRARAGLSLIKSTNPSISQSNLILAIEQERRVELFCEWGHRWLDLRRQDRISEVLSPVKPLWSPEDALYPLPASEISKNKNLQPQNYGY